MFDIPDAPKRMRRGRKERLEGLRRRTTQHLQNAHRSLSIQKMQPESHPTIPSCGTGGII
jgi:hypothetical protein